MGLSRGAMNLPPFKRATFTANSKAGEVFVPRTYTGSAVPCIYYHTGRGQSAMSLVDFVPTREILGYFMDAGYLFCKVATDDDNWGNQAALDTYAALQTYMLANYSVSKCGLLAASMGGLSSLLMASSGTMTNLKGWLGWYPACSLSDMFGSNVGQFAPFIRTAYGIASDGSDYSTKTSGHDPLLKTASLFAGLYMRFYSSAGDTVVSKTNNGDAMSTHVSGQATENTVVTCSGNHGDNSHYQYVDGAAFFARAFA